MLDPSYCVCPSCGEAMSYSEWRIFGICSQCDPELIDPHDDTWDYEDEFDEIGYDPYSGTTDPYVDWYDDHNDF